MTRFSLNKLFIFLLLLSLSACNNNKGSKTSSFKLFKGDFVDIEQFQATNASLNIPPTPSLDSSKKKVEMPSMEEYIYQAYQQNQNKPFWINDEGPKVALKQFVTALEDLKNEGIKLDLDSVKTIISKLENEKKIPVADLVNMDRKLSQVYADAAHSLLMGESFNKIDNQWFVENDSNFCLAPYLVHAFELSDSFPSLDTFRSQLTEYKLILEDIKKWQNLSKDSAYLAAKQNSTDDAALSIIIDKECNVEPLAANDSLDEKGKKVMQFQSFYNLKKTGKLDDATSKQLKKQPSDYIALLQVNLNRLRRAPRKMESEYVWVNIPLMELNYYKNGEQKFHSNVIVGKPARPTPSISSPMTNIVFNPPWGVPPTILKNDVGSGLARRGSSYLARKGLRAYDSRGRDVTSQVNASNYRKYFISQPPGAGNALGEVKFNMPNGEAIYIHDTPHREAFKNSYRALSSGCVRTENPKELAEIILGTDSFPMSRIKEIVSTRKTYSKVLDKKIPVFILYLTVAPHPSGKGLVYLSDIYGRDKKMLNLQ